MPKLGLRNLNQTAVYWAFSSWDNYGNPVVSSTNIEIPVLWDETSGEVLGADGSPITYEATVYVDRDIARGGVMWLGDLDDLPSPPTSGLMEVIQFNKSPDVKGRVNVRSVRVKQFRGSLPTTE